MCVHVCVCMYVCVKGGGWEREKYREKGEREIEREGEIVTGNGGGETEGERV